MNIFTKLYYERKNGEKLSSFLIRITLAYTVAFFILGIPFLLLFAFFNDEPLIDSTIRHGIPLYIGLIVGGSMGLLLKEGFLNRRKEK